MGLRLVPLLLWPCVLAAVACDFGVQGAVLNDTSDSVVVVIAGYSHELAPGESAEFAELGDLGWVTVKNRGGAEIANRYFRRDEATSAGDFQLLVSELVESSRPVLLTNDSGATVSVSVNGYVPVRMAPGQVTTVRLTSAGQSLRLRVRDEHGRTLADELISSGRIVEDQHQVRISGLIGGY